MPKKAAGRRDVSANWVAVGWGEIIAKSSNGNDWTAAAGSTTNKGGLTSGRAVAYGKDGTGAGLWVAVGGGVIIAKSSDGNVWTPAATNPNIVGKAGIQSGYGVAYGKDGTGAGLWVAVGDGLLIAKSTDGNVWTPTAFVDGINGKGGITNYGYGVAYGKDGNGAGLWVAVGEGGLIAKSTDGNVWSAAVTFGDLTTRVRGVAYGKNNSGSGLWVVVGQGAIIASSSNGSYWTAAPTNPDFVGKGGLTSGYGVAYGKNALGAGLWVAVGQGGIIAKSPNGYNWTPAYTSVAGNVGGITGIGTAVAYGKDGNGAGLWVAVGDGGIIAKSTDGNIWTPAATKGGITTYGWGVAFKNEII